MTRGSTSWRYDGIAAGCHTLKVDAWTGVFSHDVWYNAKVEVRPNMELRYQARTGVFELVGKGKIAPPPPAAPVVSADAVNDALDYIKDAIDANGDADSDCSGKMGGKLEAINDLLGELRAGNGDLNKTLTKMQDAVGFADDNCPKRLASKLDTKLNKAINRLQRN
jgi:hypothetical protein